MTASMAFVGSISVTMTSAPNPRARLAAAEVNADGGLKVGDKRCHVTVVPYDSKYTADGAAAGANALFAEGVKFIIGPVGAPEATGIKPVAARNGQIAWNGSFAKDALATRYPDRKSTRL